jgi:hypothetical protein
MRLHRIFGLLGRRNYSSGKSPYTASILLPKTEYPLWPKHDLIQQRFLNKCVEECYLWQVPLTVRAKTELVDEFGWGDSYSTRWSPVRERGVTYGYPVDYGG